jgi:hypothetical protein
MAELERRRHRLCETGPHIPNSAIMDIFVINFHGNYVLQQRFSLGIDLGTSNSAVAL